MLKNPVLEEELPRLEWKSNEPAIMHICYITLLDWV